MVAERIAAEVAVRSVNLNNNGTDNTTVAIANARGQEQVRCNRKWERTNNWRGQETQRNQRNQQQQNASVHSVNLQSSDISDGKCPLRLILYIRSVGPVDYFQSPLEDEDSHRLRFRCRYLVHVSGFWWASVKTEVKVRHSPIHPNVKYKWGKNMALNTYCQYIYKIIVLGKGSEKKPGKIVPFWPNLRLFSTFFPQVHPLFCRIFVPFRQNYCLWYSRNLFLKKTKMNYWFIIHDTKEISEKILKFQIGSRMLNFTHILEIVPSPPQ